MRTKLMIFAVLASALAGCSQDVAPTGSHLRIVNERAMTSQTLYMVPGVTDAPVTADDLTTMQIAIDTAIPVRVEIFDRVAVAWYAPNGEAIVARDAMVALWPVVQRVEINDDVAVGSETETVNVTAPDTTLYLGSPTLESIEPYSETETVTATNTLEDQSVDSQELTTTVWQQTIIDFLDRIGSPEESYLMEYLTEDHPGCL